VIWVCDSCGKTMFPKRLLCPECGSREFHEEEVERATLEDFSDRGDVKLGQVRARDAILIARVEIDEPQQGMQVRLSVDGGIPVVRA
jgi:uncharacterized OB-fold protein